MKELKEELNYGKKGITLISLVITIIILLILAGVTISALVGNNGILNQATKASKVTENSVATEEKRLNEYGNIIDSYIDNEKDSFVKIVTAENYGDYVDYPIDINGDGNTTNDWKIFYNNGTNIFLIAADYVKSNSEYLDLELAEMFRVADNLNYSGNTYSINWYDNLTSISKLSKHTGNDYINGSIAQLFKYDKYYKSYLNSTNINVKVTASLLDTIAWSKFVNTRYANYAIGGSTLEMWLESYNSKGYTPLYTNINDIGYYIGNIEYPTSEYYDLTNDANTGYNDTLYFPHKSLEDNCWGYWLASPSVHNSNDCIMCVGYNGYVHRGGYGNIDVALRPVVSLKSNISSAIGENGIWTLFN